MRLFWRSGARSAPPSSTERAAGPPARGGAPLREPARTRPAPLTGPSDERLCDLTAELATPLYRLAPTAQLAAGERLEVSSDRRPVSFLVSGGTVELGGTVDGAFLPLGSFGKGTCVRIPDASGSDAADLGVRAASRATLLELGSAVLEGVPLEARAAVALRSAAAASACAGAALARVRRAQHAAGDLARAAAALRERRRAAVAHPDVEQALDAIPKLPVHATELMQRLLAPGAHMNEIADLIRKDPPLASLVLKTVNSPYFALRTKVADCYRAILLLGVNHVYQIVLDGGIRAALPPTREVEVVQAHSWVVSTIAHDLAAAVGAAPQVAATVGLLHDLGTAVVPQLAAGRPGLAPFLPLLDEARLAAELLRRWGVPEEVAAVIDRQAEPEVRPPEEVDEPLRRELLVLHVAHTCAERFSGAPSAEARPAPFIDRHLEALGRPERDVEELLAGWLRPALAKQARSMPRPVRTLLGLADPDGDDGASAAPAEPPT